MTHTAISKTTQRSRMCRIFWGARLKNWVHNICLMVFLCFQVVCKNHVCRVCVSTMICDASDEIIDDGSKKFPEFLKYGHFN